MIALGLTKDITIISVHEADYALSGRYDDQIE